jgi:hypothetical protein
MPEEDMIAILLYGPASNVKITFYIEYNTDVIT